MHLHRRRPPNPYDYLPDVPSFTVTSPDITHESRLHLPQVHTGGGGDNTSPDLSWSGYPAETKSFAVTVFDPDAPTLCGWWHWQVVDIPADITHLERGAGDGTGLPAQAVQMRNDYGDPGFGGAGPPPGDADHRYYFVVHALDVEQLGLGPDTTNAVVGFHLTAHALARATIVCTYSH
ncbi:MAG: YbhB/YbcL family Raf kinase inhibitor-like protein [Candidatus Nanopelagicales bacterium]